MFSCTSTKIFSLHLIWNQETETIFYAGAVVQLSGIVVAYVHILLTTPAIYKFILLLILESDLTSVLNVVKHSLKEVASSVISLATSIFPLLFKHIYAIHLGWPTKLFQVFLFTLKNSIFQFINYDNKWEVIVMSLILWTWINELKL